MSGPEEEHEFNGSPARPPRPPAPGTVQAAAILLYVGGALTVLVALTGLASGTTAGLIRAGIYLLLGVAYLSLARAVQLGRRWARRAVLILCGVGAALAVVRL